MTRAVYNGDVEPSILFPAVYITDISHLNSQTVPNLLSWAYDECLDAGIRPKVVRFQVQDRFYDVPWTDIVASMNLTGVDLAFALPVKKDRAVDISVGATAQLYNIRPADLRKKLGRFRFQPALVRE